MLNELLSIFILLDKEKFDIAKKDMIALIIDNKFSPTARGEFASASEIIEKMFINADNSFYLRIEYCYWCNDNTCSIVKDNHDNSIKKDKVYNYQFSHVIHVISSKVAF